MTIASEGSKGMASRLAQKAGLKLPNFDQTLTRSKSDVMPSKSKRIVDIGRSFEKEELSDTHHSYAFECEVNYWPAGLSLPESGKLHLGEFMLVFRGITGTEVKFEYDTVYVERASRVGGLIHDAIKLSLKDAASKNDTNQEYLFTTILKDRELVFNKIQDAISQAEARPKQQKQHVSTKRENGPPFKMPADEVMGKMSIIGKEKLRGVSMQDYYEVAWSEGQNSTKPPIYASFLTSCGKQNVQVSPWEEGQYKGDWCQQSYTHQRLINFDFMKQTIGQTLVQVKHVQRLLRYNNDRCIVHISMEMKGFPFADCFVVEVRHIATRDGEYDLLVEVGMFVRFIKGCMFESKIRNNTGNETSKAQLELLRRVCEGCKEYAIKAQDEESEPLEEELDVIISSRSDETTTCKRSAELTKATSALHAILLILAPLFQRYVQPYIPYTFKPAQGSSFHEVMQDIRLRISVLKDISLKSVGKEDQEEVKSEILAIEKTLSKIEAMISPSSDG